MISKFDKAEEGWTPCRATLFIAGGSAVLWVLIIAGICRLV